MSSIKIIGISAFYHDAAVCLIVDGRIVYAAQEERFSRIKHDASFPKLALQDCLEHSSISLQEVTAIIYYEKPFLKFERILTTALNNAPRGLFSFVHAMQVWTKEKLFLKKNIYEALKKLDSNYRPAQTPLLFSTHHLSHAASAFYPSCFEEAAILTIDGVGEYTTTSLAYGHKNKIDILNEIHFPHSLGLFYSSITYFLGFRVNSDEYKVMGLAAYGNPTDVETIHFIDTIEKELIYFTAEGSYQLNMQYFSYEYDFTMISAKKWEQLFNIDLRLSEGTITQRHCNLAFAFQKVTEKAVLNLCRILKNLTQSSNLCLAGGVALNCVINGLIKDSNIFSAIFIQPASGDAGGAIGAGLAAYHLHFDKARTIQHPDSMQNSLLGNSCTPASIQALTVLHRKHEICVDYEEVCYKTATLISEGNVVGWVQGRAEFGPRALGNRSILADARNPDMQKQLNLQIKNRESFRPFAPAVLEEDAALYFNMEGTSPYMLQVHRLHRNYLHTVSPDYASLTLSEKLYTIKSSIPAVTHVDFSARIQTVNKAQHPLFWQLIHTFKQLTGYGLLINTSFNIRDEPIVWSAADAYACFMKTGMDILVLDKTIFYK